MIVLNRLLQEFYQSPNNGRQIVSLGEDRRLLIDHSALSGPGRISARLSTVAGAERKGDFTAPVRLVGVEGGVEGATAPGLGACALLTQGQLHLAWTATDGVWHARVPADRVMCPEAWTAAARAVAGAMWLGDLLRHRGGPCMLLREADDATGSEGIAAAFWQEGSWAKCPLWETGPTYPPVGHVDPEDRLHLAWGDVPGRLWYGTLSPEGLPEGEPLLLSAEGRQPAIIALGDQILIVYEDRYPHIHYAVVQGREVVQRGALTWGHPWFMGDLVHSPQLTIDRHGVGWCFFVDNTRRSTFWARWMGAGFGEVTNGPRLYYRPPHFDWNLLPIGRLSVEKDASASADIGLLLTLERPLEGAEYRCVSVPDHPSAAGSSVLFLDGLELSEMSGVGLEVLAAERHPDNPLLDVGPEGAFDSDRVYNHGAVLKDGAGYRMWYGAIHVPGPGVEWWDTISAGYAESADGIAWDKVEVGLVEWKGSKNNNIVPHLRHSPLMIRDEGDPDPAQRYKSLYVWNSGEMGEMARTGKYGMSYDPREEYFPAILFTSPDGLHLKPHEARVVFPEGGTKPFSIIPQSFFRDPAEKDPARQWKAYGFMSLNLRRRGGAYMYSADAITWQVHPEVPILDPAVRGTPAVVGGPESQIHDTVVFPYKGYYLALYQNQYGADRLDIELAASRDGETFVHIKPGEKILPLGPEGAWDSEHIVQTMPVLLEGEIRIYYGGGRHVEVPVAERARLGDRELRFLPGLATLREDGFTCVELLPQATTGVLTTIPFRLDQVCGLGLNARCSSACPIRVEVLEAAGEFPVPGYSLDKSCPISGDGCRIPVKWQGTARLPAGRPMRLRFHFSGHAGVPRLYSYCFRGGVE